ncbi:XK-related protein 6 [Plodia interpunctella]|uniref:XK-related protein 6 n=1 Tax=Plodia interpunctella TaxID=58824 RepID=UPI0023687D7D|nr:XK-related protein 6 [Plodia interpunctella]
MPKAVRELLQNGHSYDEPDRMPKNISITNLDLIMYVVAIIGHFVDLAVDLNVAVRYYLAKEMEAFGWTLAFILFPAFVNTAVSIRMYSQDKQQDSLTNEVTRRHWLRIFILVLQMAPILRFTDALIYAVKSRRAERKNDPASQRLYYHLMLKEDSDAALLRIFECFLEACPQLVLQTAIMLMGHQQFTLHQSLSMTSSLVGMGWCLAAYQRAVRFAQEDKLNVTWCGSAMQTVWHYLLTLSRVMSVAVISHLFPYWTVLACSIHILVMTSWIQLYERPIFCAQTRIAEISFSFALGCVYLFTYILSVEGRTRYRYAMYYTMCFIENSACGVLWYLYIRDEIRYSTVFYIVLVLIVVPYVLGVTVMVVYYSFLHPTLRNKNEAVSVAFKVNDQTFEAS